MTESSSRLIRREWIDRYSSAFSDLVEGQAEPEDLLIQGSALFYVNGDRAPEEVARTHFENCTRVTEDVVGDGLL